MISAIYASISAVLICWLILNVVKARRKNQVRYGDGDVDELVVARSAHSNAIETIPIALILLFSLEYNGGFVWLVNILGISLVLGRVIHARAILWGGLKGRKLGMQMTIFTILALVIANMVFMPYQTLVS